MRREEGAAICRIPKTRVIAFPPAAMKRFFAIGVFILLLQSGLDAAVVTLGSSNPQGSTSFNTALGWSNGLSPAAANDYFTNGYNLRTPETSASSYTFAGKSLTINTTGNGIGAMLLKNSIAAAFQFSDLRLAGGFINNAGTGNITTTLAGNLAVNSAGGTIWTNNGNFVLNAATALNGRLTIWGGSNPAVDFTASGNMTFGSGASLVFSDYNPAFSSINTNYIDFTQTSASTFTFTLNGATGPFISAEAINNTVAGSRILNFEGIFAFDLTSLVYEAGDSWTVVTAASDLNVGITYGSGFSVAGFTEVSNGLWRSSNGAWEFREATGVLTVVPEPATAFLGFAGLSALLLLRRTSARTRLSK